MNYASASVRVSLELPQGWYGLDLQGDDIGGQVRAMVEERAAAEPALSRHFRDLTQSLQDLAAEGVERNAVLTGLLLDVINDAPVVGHLLAFVAQWEGFEQGPGFDDLAVDLAIPRYGDVGPRYVDRVELPAANAVKVAFIGETARGEDGSTVALSAVQYWVPLDHTSEVLILSFTTPTLALADELEKMFDAVAMTLELEGARAGGNT